jgi:hypothetical protein
MKNKGLSKDVIIQVIRSKGWFWIDHNRGLKKKLREIVSEGHAVMKFKNKHGVHYVRPNEDNNTQRMAPSMGSISDKTS